MDVSLIFVSYFPDQPEPGRRTACRQRGQLPPVLLLHPGPAHRPRQLRHHRVLDQPTHQDPGRPPAGSDPSRQGRGDPDLGGQGRQQGHAQQSQGRGWSRGAVS